MRYFHKTNNQFFCPTINLDSVWTLVSEEVKAKYAKANPEKDNVPVIDCVKNVRRCLALVWVWVGEGRARGRGNTGGLGCHASCAGVGGEDTTLPLPVDGGGLRPRVCFFSGPCGSVWLLVCSPPGANMVAICACVRVPQGYFKVLGKGQLPKQAVIVKAKFFSKSAERKIKAVGGVAVLTA